MSASSSEGTVYTVTELTKRVRRLLESQWAMLWVEGELSNVKRHSSGHVYFTLKDEGAALRGVIFRGRAGRGLRFDPEDGMKVRVLGSLSVYEPQGSYQIVATRLEALGVGELEIAFRQTHARLETEGLFAAEHKQPLPRYPQVIGIVTSETGAAVRDLFSVLGRRAPQVRLVVRPARVQGAGAAEEIVRAIEDLNEWGGADVLIVGRGGGSLEDLWAFNEEIVARAIFASETPIVSAVGHEVDTTIADFVADRRAPTPSAAGELTVVDRESLRQGITDLQQRMAHGLMRHLRERRERVILAAAAPALRRPWELMRRRGQDVDVWRERLQASAEHLLELGRLRWAGGSGRLHALSPLAVLQRGYAVVRSQQGRVVRAADDVTVGEAVDVHLHEGQITCSVTERRSTSP